MSEPGAAIARFDFISGEQRGSHLTLFAGNLVHRGDSHLETLPLATIASVRVSFQRNVSLMGWGAALLLAAVFMLLAASPVAGVAAAAAADVGSAGGHGVARALYNLFRTIEALANALPIAALAAVLGGGALAVFGWLGNTILTLSFAGTERAFAVRGRSTRLLDFTEAVAERLMQVRR
jgi:hypothetical protein